MTVLGRSLQAALSEFTGGELKLVLHVDNLAAITLASGGGSQRTRHLRVRSACIRQLVDTNQLVVQHCPGEYQRGDLLTKALPSARLAELRDLVGLVQEELPRDGALQPYRRGSNFRQVGVSDLLTLIDTLRERAAQGAGEHLRALHDLRAYASCPSTRSTLSPTFPGPTPKCSIPAWPRGILDHRRQIQHRHAQPGNTSSPKPQDPKPQLT